MSLTRHWRGIGSVLASIGAGGRLPLGHVSRRRLRGRLSPCYRLVPGAGHSPVILRGVRAVHIGRRAKLGRSWGHCVSGSPEAEGRRIWVGRGLLGRVGWWRWAMVRCVYSVGVVGCWRLGGRVGRWRGVVPRACSRFRRCVGGLRRLLGGDAEDLHQLAAAHVGGWCISWCTWAAATAWSTPSAAVASAAPAGRAVAGRSRGGGGADVRVMWVVGELGCTMVGGGPVACRHLADTPVLVVH